ncbi:glycerol kinase [Thiogranum longum]|uniref:Glycerol kinase n=1 Tax=Thiogranum longum TaxID=1537524 RepID=A0A4R1H6I7_9GAMM|nr:FGGY family carbohydrate kinase [Thiogranum longum]TCK17367.1 glycerol kinase [Thiogranum longum]
MDYVLAIDQGTHASRALLFDANGKRVAGHLIPVTLNRAQVNRVEQDPGEILDSVTEAVRQTLQSLPPGERDRVHACGITTQRSTVLAWQANGAPLSAAISWQDTRGAPLVTALQPHATAIRECSGLPLSAHYGASKLHWLHQLLASEPELRLGPLASFLLMHLTGGGHVVDHSNAQRMQLMDISSLDWSNQLADWFQLPLHNLPECRPVVTDYGKLVDSDIPITAVCGDQNAAWHSNGVPAHGCARINLGSGAFILAAQPPNDGIPELLSSLSCSDTQNAEWLIEGTVNGAGSALQWFSEQYGVNDLTARLPEWLADITSPPLFVNSTGGLGSPWWRPQTEQKFVPENPALTKAERAVAVIESILFLLQYNLQYMLRVTTLEHLQVSGGLSHLDALCQKLANLSQRPVERSDDPEASARGVAWLAGGQSGDWSARGEAPVFYPRVDAPLLDRYRKFVDLLDQQAGTPNDN